MNKGIVLRNLKQVNGEAIDIHIDDGMITDIIPASKDQGAKEYFNETGLYVSSGWIDLHVHAVSEFDPYGDDMDEIGVKQGVTTIVDAGSCGADRIGTLFTDSAQAMTKVFAFLNISHIGLQRIDELSRLEWIDHDKVIKAVQRYPEFIVGLKARISQSVVKENRIIPLKLARQLSSETKLPLMVHIGSAPPDIREVLALLVRKDIVTHYLNGKPNHVFDQHGKPLPELLAAIERGVHLDVGHGNASFSFQTAEKAKAAGIGLNTISTDIYRRNRLHGPVYSMSNLLSKFLCLGYSLDEVIEAVTSQAAAWLNKPELGGIVVGQKANLTFFALRSGRLALLDSEGEERIADHYIEAKGVFTNGALITC
ncbi:MAG: amidohydrolase/deacetylase family metallohydrolase [Gorillibacterium sp.]|nr:amidohydrolase/deacetylase family metallohydrolase [Gorillibacterium sp.]